MIGKLAAGLSTLALLAGGLWSFGFDAFVRDARAVEPPPPPADGIVVLTGGADRIDTGLRLLGEGLAPALLISGVARGSDLADIVRHDPAVLGLPVTLGRTATTTIGNASETAEWARQHDATRLIVVTAGYHMRRALLEIARTLPEATLYPVKVQPPALRGPLDIGTGHLLATEYDKLLAVRFGLTRIVRVMGKP